MKCTTFIGMQAVKVSVLPLTSHEAQHVIQAAHDMDHAVSWREDMSGAWWVVISKWAPYGNLTKRALNGAVMAYMGDKVSGGLVEWGKAADAYGDWYTDEWIGSQ